ILGASPMPSHRMKSGRSAILGMGKIADTIGMPMARVTDHNPIAMPTARPSPVPIAQPELMRSSDIERWRQRSPESTRFQSASQIATGEGRNTGSIQRRAIATCHSAMTIANAIQEWSAFGTGRNPPPRKATSRRPAAMDAPATGAEIVSSSIDDLPICARGLVPDQGPQPVAEIGELDLRRFLRALTLRNAHLDHFLDPSWPARQYHDSVGEPQALVEIMCNVNTGDALPQPEVEEILHQQV